MPGEEQAEILKMISKGLSFSKLPPGCSLSLRRRRSNYATIHSRPQRPRSFWSAPRITTSGQVQRHSGFEWLCTHNRLRPEPIRFVRLDSEHAQRDGRSVNRGLPLLDLARGRDSWCWPKGAQPLGTRMVVVSSRTPFRKFCRRVENVSIFIFFWLVKRCTWFQFHM